MRGLIKTSAIALVLASLVLTGCRTTKEALQIGEAAEVNPGPCPRAFSLYDAARIVEFKGDKQRFDNVGFTGEIGNIRSLCRYYGEQPIIGDIEIEFDFGRGPAASGDTAVYEYFVAVTRKKHRGYQQASVPTASDIPCGQRPCSRNRAG